MDNFFILLNHTQLPENTGMAIRAMVNTGAKNLRLINPQHEWPCQRVHLASAEKSEYVNVEIFKDVRSAISDLNIVYATSARPRNMIVKTYSPDVLIRHNIRTEKVGVLFGSEKDGLSNEDVSLCNAIIEIPSVNFSSYNLAQAVLIICYQFLANIHKEEIHTGKTLLAQHRQVDNFVDNMENILHEKQYFCSEEQQIQMMRTIRNFFKRSSITTQEIQSITGVLLALTREQKRSK